MFILNTWQFYLIGYLVFIVLFYQGYKLAVRHAKRDGAATILLQAIAGGSLLLLTPLFPFNLPGNIFFYVLLILACLFYAINDRLQTTARKHLEVSVFTIINQLSIVLLIIYGFVFFKEPFVQGKALGALLVLGGNFLLFYKKGGLKFNRFSIIAIFSTIAFSIAVSIDISNSHNFNLPFYIALTLLIPALFIFMADRVPVKAVVKEFNSPARKYYVITGICWGLAILFSLRAFQLKDVATVVPLEATSVLLNVLLAYIVFSERDDRIKKVIAAILVIIGIYLTTVS